ncbi:MAG: Dabb family protein [Chitinophagaceae bacterium]|nr:Dabb family protein [Chitinophagaceae bacterium]MCW5925530.1 Dabb family protein [Chitinophagaceae bacterium]
MVRHFGVFKFKPGVTEEQIEQCFISMKGMVEKIEGLLDMEYGPYNGNEGLNEDFTHGFLMTFTSEEARDAYLPHPVHEEVKLFVVPKLERVIVFDINIPGQ